MKNDHVGFLQILPAVIWVIIVLVIAIFRRNGKREQPHYKYYLPNIYAKLFFAISYGLVYIFYYGGGDTTAFFDGSVTLNNLFFKSPQLYLEEMVSTPNIQQWHYYYDTRTGFPPGWIYREPEGFFVCKVMSLISFFTLKSYFAMTVIMSFITAGATWRLFEFIRGFGICNERLLAIGVLLLPSVNFWCSGISKDTLVFISMIYLLIGVFKLLSSEHKTTIGSTVAAIIALYFILNIRPFMLFAILVPMMFALSSRFIRFFGGNDRSVLIFRFLMVGIGIAAVGGRFISQSEEEFLQSNAYVQEASVIQNDFAQNELYGSKKYNIGTIEFTPLGMIRASPMAIIAGIYYPFPWQATSVTLAMNGLECIVFLYFTWLFIRRGVWTKLRKIGAHEFLVFCLAFVLILAFMTGLTAGLYGVLVRLRAPLLPFLFVIFTIDWNAITLPERKRLKTQPFK